MQTPAQQASARPDPSLREGAGLAAELGVDPRRGLGAEEAAARLLRFGPNRLAAAEPEPAWRRLAAQLADPLVYLLLAAVAVSLVAWAVEGAEGVPYDAVVIGAILLVNAALGFAQEARAERAVAALQEMTETTALVLRDGEERRVAAAELVPGDVLALAEGDAVSADARLLEETSLSVAEAALTGESEPVLKDAATLPAPAALADRVNMVFAGTAVTRGRARALVTATGMATEMGRIAGLLGRAERESTPLGEEVARVGRMLGVAVVAIAVVVVAAIFLTTDVRTSTDVVDVLLVGVSLAVAAVPEGLPAILSVVLALGVQRMARRRAIVKKLASVETLGSASVICADKTGTLTENEMTIERALTPSAEVEITGGGYEPRGEPRLGGRPLADPRALEELSALIAGGCLAGSASLREEGGRWTIEGDPTDAAFLVAEAKIAGLAESREARFERVGEVPFSSERRLMSGLHADLERGRGLAVLTKGAPDVLLARCAAERVAGEERPLSDARRTEILAAVDRLAGLALRPLAVAYRSLPAAEPRPEPTPAVERELVYLGTVGIIDPPRPQARAAVSEAREAGVRVMMITGDHPRTGARIAADLGIAPAGAPVLTGAEIERLDEEGLRGALRETSVCARVSPEHKLRIVEALQAEGRIVAMTGDGVNDAPALKAAEIGVAMGVAGTEVAKEAADMILADDDFATIVAAVREGRGIFADVRKFLRFLLSSNAGEVLTMFLGVALAAPLGLGGRGDGLAVPLLATQILWINLLTDSAPALAIGVDPPPEDVMRRPPRRRGERIIDAGMWRGIAWIGAVMAVATLAALELGLSGGLLGGSGGVEEGRTMAFTTLVLAQLFNCFNARSDRTSAFHRLFSNRLLWGAIGLSAALQVAVVELPFLNRAFSTVPLGAGEWAICVGLASAVLWAGEARKLLIHKH